MFTLITDGIVMENIMKLPLLKAMEGAASQCIPGMGYGPSWGGIYTCQGYTSWSCSIANPASRVPIGKHGSHMGIWKQKAHTITSTNKQHNESVEGSTLKEKTHLRTPGIIGICLRRHLGRSLLFLQHGGEVNRIPQCVWQINYDPMLLIPQRWEPL